MLTLEEIISELEKRTALSKDQVLEKIQAKQEEMSGLVSSEGAAHLVARDLGIDLLKLPRKPLKIKNITAEMKNINIKARILDITSIREFQKKDGRTGKVCNLMITDGTAETRIPLWDKQVEMVDELLHVGDVIEVKNAIARDAVFGGVELVLLKSSKIERVEDDGSIPPTPIGKTTGRIAIKNVREGFFEIRGNVVDIFNVNPVFHVCPQCRSKVELTGDGYSCQEHGKVEPESGMIITGIVDDGTGSIRAVLFRDKAQDISDLDPKALSGMSQEEALSLIKERVLGGEFVLKGRIQRNKIFDTLEMVVDSVESVNIEEESKRLINEIESFKWM